MIASQICPFLLAFALLLPGATASAQRMAAILVDVEGRIDPEMQAGHEIAAGETLSLTPASTVTLVHYGTCEHVIVRGGRVVLRESGFDTPGGTILLREEASCPAARRPQLAREKEVSGLGGLRMRNMPPAQAIPVRPSIVLVGEAARDVVAVEVEKDGRTIARLPVRRQNAVWPSDAPALQPGLGYAVKMLYRRGETSSVPASVTRHLRADAAVPTVLIAQR